MMKKLHKGKIKLRRYKAGEEQMPEVDSKSIKEKGGKKVRALDVLAEMPVDMFPKKRKDPRPQRRRGL